MNKNFLENLHYIEELSRKNLNKIELLKGYCENNEGRNINSCVICDILEEMEIEHKNILNYIDMQNIKLIKKKFNM